MPRSPERGFVMVMAVTACQQIRRSGCTVFRVCGFAHPDQILMPGARWRSCRAGLA